LSNAVLFAESSLVSYPPLKRCLLPTSSLSPKQTFQTLSNPIYSRKIEVRSESGDDIGSGGLLNVVSEMSKIVS